MPLVEHAMDSPLGRWRVAEWWVRERVPRARAADPAVAWIAAEIERAHGMLPIGAPRERTGLSPARLLSAFRTQVGTSPKRFARIVRLVASARADALGMRAPRELGAVTQGIYIAVADVEAHHARALAAGVEVVRPLADTDYGSREYLARDLEGHLWSFGTYVSAAEGSAD
jgi:hypothetical protein